jgi:hypothetical protein
MDLICWIIHVMEGKFSVEMNECIRLITLENRYMLIGGRRGHVATFDWKDGKLGCELHLNETVRDVW